MDKQDFFKKWYNAFASDVDEQVMITRVLPVSCMPWHIFTFGEVKSIESKDIKNEFKKLDYIGAIVIIGYKDDYIETRLESIDHFFEIIKTHIDVYITDKKYNWTYVKTHESNFGPYLLIK